MEEKLKELRAIVEQYGKYFTDDLREMLGCDDAEKGLDFFNNGGLSYYDERNDQSVAIWAVYVTEGGKMEVAFIWNYGKDEGWVDDAEFNIDRFGAFVEWEIEKIINRAKEIWQN